MADTPTTAGSAADPTPTPAPATQTLQQPVTVERATLSPNRMSAVSGATVGVAGASAATLSLIPVISYGFQVAQEWPRLPTPAPEAIAGMAFLGTSALAIVAHLWVRLCVNTKGVVVWTGNLITQIATRKG